MAKPLSPAQLAARAAFAEAKANKPARVAKTPKPKDPDKLAARAASQPAEGSHDVVRAKAQSEGKTGSALGIAVGSHRTPKIILSARDNLARAFDDMGGVPALVEWGKVNPTEFYRLWARLIPKEASEAPSMPLETLLEKLATREEMSVGQAAMDIGMEMIEKGRLGAEREDLENLTKGTLQ